MGKEFKPIKTDKSKIRKETKIAKISKIIINVAAIACTAFGVSALIGANRKHDDSTKS